jgi:hypothetical protein
MGEKKTHSFLRPVIVQKKLEGYVMNWESFVNNDNCPDYVQLRGIRVTHHGRGIVRVANTRSGTGGVNNGLPEQVSIGKPRPALGLFRTNSRHKLQSFIVLTENSAVKRSTFSSQFTKFWKEYLLSAVSSVIWSNLHFRDEFTAMWW